MRYETEIDGDIVKGAVQIEVDRRKFANEILEGMGQEIKDELEKSKKNKKESLFKRLTRILS